MGKQNEEENKQIVIQKLKIEPQNTKSSMENAPNISSIENGHFTVT